MTPSRNKYLEAGCSTIYLKFPLTNDLSIVLGVPLNTQQSNAFMRILNYALKYMEQRRRFLKILIISKFTTAWLLLFTCLSEKTDWCN